MLKKSLIRLYSVLAFTLFVISSVYAADEMNVDADGVGLVGHDPVAYFTLGKPVQGKSSITAEHKGVTYQFSSAEHRRAFISNPDKYAPAYGGWCSYGVRVGKKFKVDPSAFEIVDERLFVQLDLGTKKVWLSDKKKNIEIADRLWPKIESVPAASLGN